MKSKKFKLPQCPSGSGLGSDKKVLVISFFGKSPHNAVGCKTGLLDGFLGRSIFQSSMLDDPCIEDSEALCDIEGFYDESQKIIFLHLRGVFDTHSLVKIYKQFEERLQEDGYLTVWSELNSRYARALLLIFSISHILVLSQPSHTFDLGYVYLFRSLDIIRQKVQPDVTELLRTVPQLPKDWVTNGRPCSPRVLFVFETCPAIYRQENTNKIIGSYRESGSGTTFNNAGHHGGLGWRSNNARQSAGSEDELVRPREAEFRGRPSVKRLEHALEDQIYHVLRKSRIVTNVSTNALFAIPANQEFVFVSTSRDVTRGELNHLADSLVDLCNQAGGAPRVDDPFQLSPTHGNEHSLRKLVQQHVDQAFSKGFDDNVGRHVAPAHFEMAPVGVWHAAAALLFDLLMGPSGAGAGPGAGLATALASLLGTDVNFSEARCNKVLPLATATYQENLPAHYTRDYHQTRLGVALSVLGGHARGPSCAASCARLAADCARWWRAGRQVCEVLSLTGNPCTAPLHRGGGDGAGGGQLRAEPDIDQSLLPMSAHCSGVRFVSACNCGRKHGPRDDPFSARAANLDFYQRMGDECGCGAMETFRFPVFQPSTQDYKAAQLFKAAAAASKEPTKVAVDREADARSCEAHSFSLGQSPAGAGSAGDAHIGSEQRPISSSQHSQSGFVSGQSACSDLAQEAGPALRDASPSDGHEIIIQVSDSEPDVAKEKFLIRQPSTTEYLPGMLHSDSPPGLLPRFPSWALTCLGASSLYSHNLGLQDQHQLLPGSAFLLPWDVTVRLHHHRERCWPTVGDQLYSSRSKMGSSQAAMRGRKAKPLAKDSSEFVVKIFVGVEYECPRGHRFMCSAPDKILKATGSGLVKDNGNRVTANDMPLYCACPCRSGKPLVAQLLRVHVVTPKAPVYVTLDPRVQPAPAPCPLFVAGADQPMRLSQSSYWVLRLPYVYVGDHGPYVAPKEPVPPGFGRLLAGMFSITEQPPQD